jgi:hypothetical protein
MVPEMIASVDATAQALQKNAYSPWPVSRLFFGTIYQRQSLARQQ